MVGDETPSLLPEGAVAVRFHSIGGWGAITTGKNLGAILGDLNDLLYERDGLKDDLGNPKEVIHVSANPKYGSEKKGAPTSYFMVAAKDRIRVNCDLRHVTVVLCCDPKAFTHTNPLDGMQEGGSLVWESDVDGERAWENLPLWARKQIIEKNIRVFTLPGFDIARKATDRGDLQLRMQGNAFLGAFFAVSPLLQEFGITQEQYPRGCAQAVREEVRQAGRCGCAVEHGSDAAGLRAGEGDQDRRADALPITPRCAARRCCRFWNWRRRADRAGRDAAPHRVPAGQGPRTPIDSDCNFRCGVPLALRLQPAGHAALGDGRDCRGDGRHGFEVRGAPRDPALHSRELHAVHGVHLGLPGYGAAELLAGSGHDAFDGGFVLRGRSGASAPRCCARCRRLRSSTRERMVAEIKTGTPLPTILREVTESVDGFSAEAKAAVLQHHRQGADGVPEGERHLLVAGAQGAGLGRHLLDLCVSDLCKGCAACVTACGDHEALKMVQETEEVNAEHETGTAFLDLLPDTSQKYPGPVQRRPIRPTRRRRRCATC